MPVEDKRPSLSNLPLQLTSLIGREKEIAAVGAKLRDQGVRLLTLTGPGGIGKSRLALAVAGKVLNGFPDGVFFVPLAPIRDPELVCSTIAQTLDLREMGAKPVFEMLKDYLRDKAMLLLLDNFEQVVAAAPRLGELLVSSPGLKFLVTSREALRLQSEQLFPVPPLESPDAKSRLSLAQLNDYEAVRLFVERARAVRPDFALYDRNAAAVVEIACRRLEGLPLAIELAAARTSVLSPAEILDRLKHRLTLLSGGARDLPERLQTMRNAIGWSHDLLADPEKKLFRRLAVFAGGCTLAAADAVGNAAQDLGTDVLTLLQSLVAKSLLRPELAGNESRYLMLETIREYGLEELERSGEGQATRLAQALFFKRLVKDAYQANAGPEAVSWLGRLKWEEDNIRSVLRWALDDGDPEIGLGMVGQLNHFWTTVGQMSEGRAWLAEALSKSSPEPSSARAWALYAASYVTGHQGDLKTGRSLGDQGLAMHRLIKNSLGVALSCWQQATYAAYSDDIALARALLEECLAVSTRMDFAVGVGLALRDLGAQSIEEDPAAAEARIMEGLTYLRQSSVKLGIALAILYLGVAALRQEEYERARTYFDQSVLNLKEIGDQWGLVVVLNYIADLAAILRQVHRAARLWGAADRVAKSFEMTGTTFTSWELTFRQRLIDATRDKVGLEVFDAVWQEGRKLSLDQAVAYALESEAASSKASPSAPSDRRTTGPLTRREREIATLIAQGIANREIASQLVISERTVESHLSNILGKLDFNSRSQVAVWATKHLA